MRGEKVNMQKLLANKKSVTGLVVVLILIGGGLTWIQRGPILSWYYLRQLAKADDGEQAVWVNRVVGIGEHAVPDILKGFEEDNARACLRYSAVLNGLANHWGFEDPRTHDLAQRTAEHFSEFSDAGKENTLNLVCAWHQQAKGHAQFSEVLTRMDERMLAETCRSDNSQVHDAALRLCEVLLTTQMGPSKAIREFVSVALSDKD